MSIIHTAQYRRRQQVTFAEVVSAANRFQHRHGLRALHGLLRETFGVADVAQVPPDQRGVLLGKLEE